MNTLKHLTRLTLLAGIAAATSLVTMTLVPRTTLAEPIMRAIETPLEGTNIISMRVNRQGRGRIQLWCHRCEDSRIELRVTPESYLTINGLRTPLQGYSPMERDFITGFYLKESGTLSRLLVTR